MSIFALLERGRRASDNGVALQFAERRIDYQALIGSVRSVAVRLQEQGICRGANVGVLAPNDPAAFCAALGTMGAGAAYLPLNPKSTAEELANVLDRLDCAAVFFHESMESLAQDAVRGAPRTALLGLAAYSAETGPSSAAHVMTKVEVPALESVAWLGQTGGTTGAPKGVELSWRAIYAFVEKFMIELPQTRPVMLAATPMTHAAGMLSLPMLAGGGRVIMMDKLDLELYVDLIERERVTATFLPPTAIYRLLDLPAARGRDYSSLRHLIYGAAPMSVTRLKQALDLFGPVMTQLYGQTECHSIICVMRPEDHYAGGVAGGRYADDLRLASCGRPSIGTIVEVRDEHGRAVPAGQPGEIAVMSDIRMNGYYRDPVETALVLREGFVHTGDIGVFDDDGFLRIVDRKKDVVISGGFNIYPAEVERVLQGHADVADCAVLGLPDADWGEVVVAVVQPKPGAVVSTESLRALARARLGAVKAPKKVFVRADLPRSPIGKVLKKELRRLLLESSEAKSS